MHFVIFANNLDYHRYSYSDLEHLQNCEYVVKDLKSSSRLLSLLFKFHNSYKLNKIIRLPFKKIWFKQLTWFENRNEKYCFIFFVGTKRFGLIKNGYIDYLRKRYPNSTFVCFCQDLIKHSLNSLSVEDIKKVFDYVYSFDQNDCKTYGFDYHQLIYSNTYSKTKNNDIVNDVYFVGQAKDRINQILTAFRFFKLKGLKCDFHIVGANEEDKRYTDEIDYCKSMSYKDNLEHISQTKAILEIMQKDGYGFTLRTCEAIMFDKMLITDNRCIQEAPFYSSNNIVLLDCVDRIDWQSSLKNTVFDYNYKSNLSPVVFLKEIEQRIEKSNENKKSSI